MYKPQVKNKQKVMFAFSVVQFFVSIHFNCNSLNSILLYLGFCIALTKAAGSLIAFKIG